MNLPIDHSSEVVDILVIQGMRYAHFDHLPVPELQMLVKEEYWAYDKDGRLLGAGVRQVWKAVPHIYECEDA